MHITLQGISSVDKPLMSSSPARNDIRELQQQLLAEKKISAKLEGNWCSGYLRK